MTDPSAPATPPERVAASERPPSEPPTSATARRRTTGGATPAPNDSAFRAARIMAVANQKGGVGKSTTAVSLGAALAERGDRVLVIDLDPQGNASTGLGIRHEARDVTIYDVLVADADVSKAVVPTPLAGLFAIPSTIDLAGAEIELVSQFSRELRLRRALEPLKTGTFDFVLLDCPPSLGLLTINALAAAEELIVPIQCEYYALEGLGQLLRNVRLVQQNVNQGLRLSGIVMTMFDPRTKLSEQVVDEVRKFFGDLVYDTIIPRTVRLSEAPGFGLPITAYDPRSRGAECYRDLAAEVAARPAPEGPMPTLDEMPTVVVEPVAPPPDAVARAPRPLRETIAAERAFEEQDETADAAPEPRAEDEPKAEDEPEAGEVFEYEDEDEPDEDEPDEEAVVQRVTPRLTPPGDAFARQDAVVDVSAPDERESTGMAVDARWTRGAEPNDAPADRPAGDRRHVVIDAYGLDPDASPSVEVDETRAFEEDDEEDDGQRKRWSLFRRGGRR